MLQPSASIPYLQTTFVHEGAARTLNIHLPALLSCFVQPVPMTAGAFDANWSKLRTDKGQQKCAVMAPKGEGAIRWLLATGMQLSVVGAPDATESSPSALATPICASGVFRCLGFPRGFGCLLRIEFRVSVWTACFGAAAYTAAYAAAYAPPLCRASLTLRFSALNATVRTTPNRLMHCRQDHEVHATARTTNDKVSNAFVSALAALWKH